jgi:hypothetical protein
MLRSTRRPATHERSLTARHLRPTLRLRGATSLATGLSAAPGEQGVTSVRGLRLRDMSSVRDRWPSECYECSQDKIALPSPESGDANGGPIIRASQGRLMWCNERRVGRGPRGSATVAPNPSAVAGVRRKENTTMADGQSMTTVADVVAQVRDGREDFVKEAVVLVVREVMEAEVVRHEALSDRVGASPCQRAVAAVRGS